MSRRTAPPRQPANPPATAEDGAARVRAALVKLFDRGDGTGMDWHLTAKSLFRCAFDLLDQLPDDQKHALARRVYTSAYDRATGDETGNYGASITDTPEANPAPSNTDGLKSSRLKPPQGSV
ncbi:MAG: hypothetical protein DLM68_00785 [Hyphomicrobiales bacterium]|nr:MAG: hypothetical protein DLM68_00785 [Hyphomicrobiales bacterium]